MFKEGLLEIKDNLESLKDKCKSTNNTILTNPVPTQIKDMTPPTYSDNPTMSTLVSQISWSINERIKKGHNIIVFNLQEQNNESDKVTIINLCKFIVDRKVICKSICLGKKEEGKIRPVKIVFPNTIVKNYFMKSLN